MKKHELLSPAGSMECLKQAVWNGCDAVYIAAKTFGARKFASNFTNEEIKEAIKFCHLYGVKLYVTMNTLVKNSEVQEFLAQAEFLHKNGVDAIIVQDFGMICYLREMYPNLEIHVSTQANIVSDEICKLYYDLGVKRVVFAREMSIEDISNIKTPIEKEVFIHGALCVSYSGCCLMSSMLGGRSGNRGECAGSCRLPYTLTKNNKVISKNKYLLSTRELNTTYKINELRDSDIYSFKIEGRMKSPLYVGFITRLYRKLLDGDNVDLGVENEKLKTIFNREFTEGRLFNANDFEIINEKSPNHIGLEIGKVLRISKNKIMLKLSPGRELHQYDAIRFLKSNKGLIVNYLYDSDGKLINSSKDICWIDNKINLEEEDVVMKTNDYQLNMEFSNITSSLIPIGMKVTAKLGRPLLIEVSDGENTVSLERDVIQKAKSSVVLEEDIKKHLNKLGQTPFKCLRFVVDLDDGVFIQIKQLNEMRRELISQLIEVRQNKHNLFEKKSVIFKKNNSNENNYAKNRINCLVYYEHQLKTCLNFGVNRIYVIDENLYHKYESNSNVYFVLPRNSYNKDNDYEKKLISDYNLYQSGEKIGDYSLNVTNIYTAYYLKKLGINDITLSVELSDDEIIDFISSYSDKFGHCDFEVLAYGRVENMLIKGNILKINKNDYAYNLIDSRNRKFPVYYDGNNTHILNYMKTMISSNRLECRVSYRVSFFEESSEEVLKVLKDYHM